MKMAKSWFFLSFQLTSSLYEGLAEKDDYTLCDTVVRLREDEEQKHNDKIRRIELWGTYEN
jgi:hypothetical protein